QLALLDARDEDGFEFEPLRAVERQQMNAGPFAARRPEACLEVGDEVARRADAVVELRGQLDEAAEVGLTDQLALAELVGRPFDPAGVLRVAANRRGDDRRRLELREARKTFSAPPSAGTIRFASASTSGVER